MKQIKTLQDLKQEINNIMALRKEQIEEDKKNYVRTSTKAKNKTKTKQLNLF